MSIPSGVLRYAGIWNVTDTYIPGMFVQSSLVNNSYAVLQAVTGGADPSVALAPDWVAFPVSGGGVTSINGLTGTPVINADPATSLDIFTNVPNFITSTYAAGSVGIYTEETGGSPTATITAAACKPGWIVQLTYVHTGGGGGSQYIKNIVRANGSFTVTCNTNIDVDDQIFWHVVGAPK